MHYDSASNGGAPSEAFSTHSTIHCHLHLPQRIVLFSQSKSWSTQLPAERDCHWGGQANMPHEMILSPSQRSSTRNATAKMRVRLYNFQLIKHNLFPPSAIERTGPVNMFSLTLWVVMFYCCFCWWWSWGAVGELCHSIHFHFLQKISVLITILSILCIKNWVHRNFTQCGHFVSIYMTKVLCTLICL